MKFHKHIKDESKLVVLDAHHITPREDMPNGGYVKQNGISVCDECHQKAEAWLKDKTSYPEFCSEELYKKIGSSYAAAVAASEKL